ncbi:dynamin family protein [Amycolatopsis sp. NPDC004772]
MSEIADRLDRVAAEILTLAEKRQVSASSRAPLAALTGRWRESVAKVAVVGEISVGKSTLINALVGAPILPTGEEPLSSVPVVLSHGRYTAATVHLVYGGQPHVHRLGGADDIATHLTTRGERVLREKYGRDARVLGAEVTAESELLASGVQLIDTPGVGGLDPAHRRRTVATLEDVDAVLFTIKPDRPINENELAFLAESADRVRTYVIVQTRRDETTHADAHLAAEMARLADTRTWSAVVGADRADELAARFAGASGVSVAAKLALDADCSTAALDRNGITELRKRLTENVVDQVAEIHLGDMVRLTRNVTAATGARLEDLLALLEAGNRNDEPVRAREERIRRWVKREGDNWRDNLRTATADAQREITERANKRIRELRRDYLDRFATMKTKAIKPAVDVLVVEPENLLVTMRGVVRERLKRAIEALTEGKKDDPIARGLDQWLTAVEMEGRLPDLGDTYRTPQTRVQVEDFTPAASFGVMSMYREQVRTTRAGNTHHGAGSALAVATAALLNPPVLITLGLAAGVFGAIGAWRRKRIDTIAAAKAVYAEVEKAILNQALPHAKKQAEGDRDAVIAGVELLTEQEQELIARDRADLDDVANLPPEERAGRKKSVEFDLAWVAQVNTELDDVEKGR